VKGTRQFFPCPWVLVPEFLFLVCYKSKFSRPEDRRLELLLSRYGIVGVFPRLDVAESGDILLEHRYGFPVDVFSVFLVGEKGHFLSKFLRIPSLYDSFDFIIHFCKFDKFSGFVHLENEVSLDSFIIQDILFDYI